MDKGNNMILIPFESSENLLCYEIFKYPYLTTVIVETYNTVYRTSYRTPMTNAFIMGTKYASSPEIFVGTFRDVAVCTTRVTVVNMPIMALYYSVSLNQHLFILVLTDQCTPNSPKTFDKVPTNAL